MLTLTLAVDHAVLVHVVLHALHGYASTCVAVAQATASHDHLIQRVVVLLLEILAWIEQIITERVQFGEVYSQVCDLE